MRVIKTMKQPKTISELRKDNDLCIKKINLIQKKCIKLSNQESRILRKYHKNISLINDIKDREYNLNVKKHEKTTLKKSQCKKTAKNYIQIISM